MQNILVGVYNLPKCSSSLQTKEVHHFMKRKTTNCACIPCKRSKKRCGMVRPCARCIQTGQLCKNANFSVRNSFMDLSPCITIHDGIGRAQLCPDLHEINTRKWLSTPMSTTGMLGLTVLDFQTLGLGKLTKLLPVTDRI